MEERRKNVRLSGYDYSQTGAYFVTVCTKDRQTLFWDRDWHESPVGADIIRPKSDNANHGPLSEIGEIVDQAIQNIPRVYDGVIVEKYVVMPNHVHLLLTLHKGRMISAPTVSAVVGGMKRWASRQCGRSLWQRGFYDHIIRDDNDFLTRWNYIDTNPARWQEDRFYEV